MDVEIKRIRIEEKDGMYCLVRLVRAYRIPIFNTWVPVLDNGNPVRAADREEAERLLDKYSRL